MPALCQRQNAKELAAVAAYAMPSGHRPIETPKHHYLILRERRGQRKRHEREGGMLGTRAEAPA